MSKYLNTEFHVGAEGPEDAVSSAERLELRLEQLRETLNALPKESPAPKRHKLMLDMGYTLLDLKQHQAAWEQAQQVLTQTIAGEQWEQAVESCDILYQCDLEHSISALAHGIWLGVTFPIDPELSIAMLQHLVDETPDHSDGAAVAAATARYIADLRSQDSQREELLFFSNQLLAQVARRHSQVEEQEIFDFWIERMQLDNPDIFLPRLAKILDVITEERWWFDRDQLRAKIPD